MPIDCGKRRDACASLPWLRGRMYVVELIRVRLWQSMTFQPRELEHQAFREPSYRQIIQFMLISAPNRIIQVEFWRNHSDSLVGIVPFQMICCKILAGTLRETVPLTLPSKECSCLTARILRESILPFCKGESPELEVYVFMPSTI